MQTPQKNLLSRRIIVALSLLLILTYVIYSNSFQAAWHLDDYPNIVKNPWLKLKNLSAGSIIQTFFSAADGGAYRAKKLYRPVPCLTFGLNYYFGKLNPPGYHHVNIFVHFMTAAFLFLTIVRLFQSPNLRGKYPQKTYFIALLSTVLWAVNPIQTQAVTYIVQRMAAMATLFYLMGLYFYIMGRLEQVSSKRRLIYFSSALLSFLLAVGSKENAVLWPVAVVMVEMIFFQDLSRSVTRKKSILILGASVFFVLLIGALIFLPKGFNILGGYKYRPFTLLERILTQPRIVIFYLSLLFYPVPSRLSIDHDITISTSLFHPWTTLPSILLIIFLCGLSIGLIYRRPLISFAVLFYILNHVIESSIIPLELIFEHRNYLPSLFLFLPISAGFSRLLDHYAKRNRWMHAVIVSFVTLLIIGLGSGTFIRNLAWATEKYLWEDALKKAPRTSRPYHNLAWAYYDRVGQYEKSLELYRKALELRKQNIAYKQVTMGNIANVYYQSGDLRKAADYWAEALALNSKNQVMRFYLAKVLFKLGDLNAASVHADKLLIKRPNHPKYLNFKGFLLVKQNKFKEALPYFKKYLKLAPYSKRAMINRGACLNLLGEYRAAEWALGYAHVNYRQDILPILWLADTNLKAGDIKDSQHYLNRLFALVNIDKLLTILKQPSEDGFEIFPNSSLLYQEIVAGLEHRAAAISGVQTGGGKRSE